MSIEELSLTNLKINGGTQPRQAISDETVLEYAEALRDGAVFPPVVVVRDGANLWLVDGFHRFHAHRSCGRETIAADVREGTLRDAVLHSLSANAEHGLRRTNADKRKAVLTMLTNKLVATDDDGNPWSDNEVARRCVVSRGVVTRTRASLAQSASEEAPSPRSYTTKHGTTAVMKTKNIGRRRATDSRPRGGLAPTAMTPVRGHSTPSKKTAIELPHDPRWAARSLLSTLGAAFVRALIPELTQCLEGDSE
jgi:uncharacterized ParB-like nuclease family protein